MHFHLRNILAKVQLEYRTRVAADAIQSGLASRQRMKDEGVYITQSGDME
ncbi:MAG: hypothetical protein HY782_19210 [Chloroflexi bacterium]|nr:hypothetical protein [Chloroflexota bacterium]